jgi:hypothetical protein
MSRAKLSAILLLAFAGAAARPEPPLLPAQLRDCETRCSNARRDYLLIVKDAKEQYVDAIEKAMKTAMRDQDLDRANRLKAEKDKVEKEIKELREQGKPATAAPDAVGNKAVQFLTIKRAELWAGGGPIDITKEMQAGVSQNGDQLHIPSGLSQKLRKGKGEGHHFINMWLIVGGVDLRLRMPDCNIDDIAWIEPPPPAWKK